MKSPRFLLALLVGTLASIAAAAQAESDNAAKDNGLAAVSLTHPVMVDRAHHSASPSLAASESSVSGGVGQLKALATQLAHVPQNRLALSITRHAPTVRSASNATWMARVAVKW